MRLGRDGADAHPFQSEGVQIIRILVTVMTHAPHQALHLIGPAQSLILRRRGSVGENLAAYAQHSERSLIGSRVESGGIGFHPGLLQGLSSAFGPLCHSRNEMLGRLLERFKIGGCAALRRRPPVQSYEPGGFEEIGERQLLVARPHLRELRLAPGERTLKTLAQAALIGSRHFAQRLEVGPPLRNFCSALQQFGSREDGQPLGFLAERHGQALVGLESGSMLRVSLLALLKDRIALLSKLIPQLLLLIALDGADIFPLQLQALHRIHGLATVFFRLQMTALAG